MRDIKYLEDWVSITDLDGEQVAELFDRHQRILDSYCTVGYQGVLNDVDTAHKKEMERLEMGYANYQPPEKRGRSDSNVEHAGNFVFFDKTTMRAIASLSKLPDDESSWYLAENRENDKERVKSILNAGLDRYGNAIPFACLTADGSDGNPPSGISTLHKEQILEARARRAAEKGVQGKQKARVDSKDAGPVGVQDGVDKTLKQIAKGVKKMTKGMDEET